MNQRTMKSAAYRLIKEYRRNCKSADVTQKTVWTDGMLRGAQTMWQVVSGHLPMSGTIWESRRHKALDKLVATIKRHHGGNHDTSLPCELCYVISDCEKLL